MTQFLIDIWQKIIIGSNKSWVLFENGTCVILMEPEADLATQAINLMKKWGPVHVGSSAADFNVITLTEGPGWVVTCHHDDILTYVSEEEIDTEDTNLFIGILGRTKRSQDAESLNVIHLEDKRQ